MKKKSPLKFQPLRYPGQSLDEKINDTAYDVIFTNLTISLFLVIYTAYQWYEQEFNKKPEPILWAIFAAISIIYTIIKFIWVRKDIANMKLGRDGEREVGQYLEELRFEGYYVFHDLLGDNFNLDHIIIGPAGAFTIETKTWRKPIKGEAKIIYDGEKVLINGYSPDKNPIIQAGAQKDWLEKVIREITGKNIPVRAVVLYPGWFIESRKRDANIWVLEPKAFPKYLKNERQILENNEVNDISFQLSRYIRASEEKRKREK